MTAEAGEVDLDSLFAGTKLAGIKGWHMLKKVWNSTDDQERQDMEHAWMSAIQTHEYALLDPKARAMVDLKEAMEQQRLETREFKGATGHEARSNNRKNINDVPAPNFQRVLHERLRDIHHGPGMQYGRKNSECCSPRKMALRPSPRFRPSRMCELASPGRLARDGATSPGQGTSQPTAATDNRAWSPRGGSDSYIKATSRAYGLRTRVAWHSTDTRERRIQQLAMPAGLAACDGPASAFPSSAGPNGMVHALGPDYGSLQPELPAGTDNYNRSPEARGAHCAASAAPAPLPPPGTTSPRVTADFPRSVFCSWQGNTSRSFGRREVSHREMARRREVIRHSRMRKRETGKRRKHEQHAKGHEAKQPVPNKSGVRFEHDIAEISPALTYREERKAARRKAGLVGMRPQGCGS